MRHGTPTVEQLNMLHITECIVAYVIKSEEERLTLKLTVKKLTKSMDNRKHAMRDIVSAMRIKITLPN